MVIKVVRVVKITLIALCLPFAVVTIPVWGAAWAFWDSARKIYDGEI